MLTKESIMINLEKKLRSNQEEQNGNNNATEKKNLTRDRLLLKEVPELYNELPSTCKLEFSDPDKLYDFFLNVTPNEGYWKQGVFRFQIVVTEEYNYVPPTVKCLTKLFHPNINEEGSVCLSILRQASIDYLGWAPTRSLKDVVWGLNSLFTDLLNFEDPLNVEAAELFQTDSAKFQRKVKDYIRKFCVNNV